ncbi:chromate transporter [Acidisoma sp. C75]
MTALLTLILVFGELSLLAFGGASSALPEMQRLVVRQEHWMSAEEFLRLYALAQAAPGPNVLAVTLFGWKVAGIGGALAATAAFLLPALILAYWMGRAWARFRDKEWRILVQAGLVPVTVGLMLASAYLLLRAAAIDQRMLALALAVALLCLVTRRHPLWYLGAAALLGLLGFT